jgi:Rad3-related DNA helicase
MTGYVQLGRTGDGRRVVAALPDSPPGVWEAREGTRAARELAAYLAGADAVVTYAAADLADWLSAPAALRETRSLLGRLVDAREAALLAAPELADFSLDAFCRTHGVQAPSVGDETSSYERWRTLAARLRERARALPPQVAGLVAAVAGPAWSDVLLGTPDAAGALGRMITAALPRRPRRARTAPEPFAQGLEETAGGALMPEGAVAAAHPAYEHRPGQIDMARAVAGAFERREFLLVEAGTGTGKSLAYLIPAVTFARSAGVPVIVSTNTKNLQDQLVERDIPLAGRALGIEFTAELLKGRSNYVCPRLLASAAERVQESVFRDDRLALAHLIAWAAQAPVADLDNLSPGALDVAPALRSMVGLVRARSEVCSGRRCSYYQSCPVEVARGKAQSADIVVVNHALLLASAGTTVLPEHEHVIIDEAHNLEDVATDQLGREVTSNSVRGLLRLLTGEGDRSLDERVSQWLASAKTAEGKAVTDACALFPEVVAKLEYALEDLAAAVLHFIDRAASLDRGADRSSIRLTPDVRASRHWESVVEALAPADAAIEATQTLLTIFLHAVTSSGKELTDSAAALELDIGQPATLLGEMRSALGIVVQGHSDHDFVCWVAGWMTRRGEQGWGLRAAPIDVGPALEEALFEGLSTAVMTSATLTVEDSFDYVRQRLGLESQSDRMLELAVPSPFDFESQLLMCIPSDLPLPGERDFDEACRDAVHGAALAARGGTLCLFTSRDTMTKAFEQLRPRLEAEGLTPLCQDVAASRTAALEVLRDDPRAVLFGVKSFWEGVDVPGEALRCLVVVKLPFAVPSDPIVQARQERVEERGLNGYDEYYVPNAVIGLRQGIGRLIRTKTDRGVVFVLDRRILLRRYGQRFLQSIPACRTERGPLRTCLEQARAMLQPGAAP